jgi:hypothetical protein
MNFHSILFDGGAADGSADEAPDCFADLHLDRVVGAIIAGREEYDLCGYFYRPLRQTDAIRYRHEVFQDLQRHPIDDCVRAFSGCMRRMRAQLGQAERLHYERQRQRWLLDAVQTYCDAVGRFAAGLAAAAPQSAGLRALGDYLHAYVQSPDFLRLQADAERVRVALAAVRYSLFIADNRVRVSRYGGGEPDYAAQVSAIFGKFAAAASRDYRFAIPADTDMNHVEAEVLDRVALLFAEAFALLARFCLDHRSYGDETLVRFDREVQFYLAYLEYSRRLTAHGLTFCYPQVTDRFDAVHGRETFDIALADALAGQGKPVVTNDFELRDPERVVVVSGPNNGGKTTFARAFGQLHYLAGIGCLVPGSSARLLLFDRLFTLFEREEHLENLSGKLEDELLRLHSILEQATARSVLIMNESLGSTTLADALSLGRRVIRQIIGRGVLCVYVTFLEELASLGASTISMVSSVDADDPVRRTFKILRRPADGLAYAMAIARKHRLTYDSVKERIHP